MVREGFPGQVMLELIELKKKTIENRIFPGTLVNGIRILVLLKWSLFLSVLFSGSSLFSLVLLLMKS